MCGLKNSTKFIVQLSTRLQTFRMFFVCSSADINVKEERLDQVALIETTCDIDVRNEQV